MATPLTAAQFITALREEGVTVVEYASWRTHNRNSVGDWGPVHGVMVHHTVTTGTKPTVELCYEGRSDLPGPLCHGVVAKDGTVHLVGHGRANHAGSGDGDVLAAVIAERKLPKDNQTDTDGNARFYGLECVNLGDGEDPWPPEQVEAVVRASAAICRAHGWGQHGDTSVIGHKEWQSGKVDPRGPGVSMSDVRRRVAERLTHPAGWNPNGARQPDQEDTGMPVPAWVNLGRTTWASVRPQEWTSVYFDDVEADDLGDHTPGGAVFAKGPAQVWGSVTVRLRGLPTGVQAQTATAAFRGDAFVGRLAALDETVGSDGHSWLKSPINARISRDQGLRIQVKHWAPQDVEVEMDAYLAVHVLRTT